MLHHNRYKVFSFLVALKRSRRNSVIMKGAAYKDCKIYGISAQTFKKYLSEAIELGFIIDQGDRYSVKKLAEIISEIHQGGNLFFGKHNILKSKELSVKKITDEILGCYVEEIFHSQTKKIITKSKKLATYKFVESETVKRHSPLTQSNLKDVKKVLKESKESRALNQKQIETSLYKHVITSARHTAAKLGISKNRSNHILSNLKSLKREIIVKWIPGCTMVNFEQAKVNFPKATIYPMPSINKIKVCFGSKLSLINLKAVEIL